MGFSLYAAFHPLLNEVYQVKSKFNYLISPRGIASYKSYFNFIILGELNGIEYSIADLIALFVITTGIHYNATNILNGMMGAKSTKEALTKLFPYV
jgi:hypothetical protein